MKLQVPSDTLKTSTGWVAGYAPNRPAIPILGGIKLDATDKLTFSCFDYETSALETVEANVDSQGSCVVSARLLSSVAKALPNKTVTLEHFETVLKVSCGASRFTLPTMNVSDYPELPEVPEVCGTVDGETFGDVVHRVGVAASTDETLPMLTGIKVVAAGGGTVELAATDRFRLAAETTAWSGDEVDALVPAKLFVAAFKGVNGPVGIGFDSGIIGVTTGARRVTFRLLDAQFPNFRQLFPKQFATTIRVDSGVLADAVKRVSMVAERSAQVVLDAVDGRLGLSAGGVDSGSAEDEIECLLDGPVVRAAFNPVYLVDGLNAQGGQVSLSFNEPSRPMVVTGGGDIQYLLMPVRLAG